MTTAKSRSLAMLLVVALLISTFAGITASATEGYNTAVQYLDDDGGEIADTEYSAASEYSGPEIMGYTFQSYAENTAHVYAPVHLTYIVGYPDGSVQPESPMTRAEAVTVFYRLYDGVYPTFTRRMSSGTFPDVDTGDWYYKAVETLYNAGLIEGYEDGTFRPNDPVSRAEFATVAANYDGLAYLDKAAFSDVVLGYWAYSCINAAAAAGWIVGYPDGTFKPENDITRAEVVTLVNRMFDRHITLDELPDGINPYNDIVETHWAYCDIMEATVDHDTASWHGAAYNGGVFNMVTEQYVDENGDTIAETVTSTGKINHHPVEFPKYVYLGYVTEITYVYAFGSPAPSVNKTASVSTASVGDTVSYVVEVGNDADATADWRGVQIADELPDHVTFAHGSVYVDGKSAEYSFQDGVLTVALADIAPGKTVTVTFDVVIASTAYGETIFNSVNAAGENTDEPETDTDGGVEIVEGEIQPYIQKTANVTHAIVGQTVTYNLEIGNGDGATYPWENAVITDTLPDGVDFVDGAVYLDGVSVPYTLKNGAFGIELGDIAPGESHTVTFRVKITEDAYSTTVYNTAIATGDNTDDVEDTDDGIVIGDGTAYPSTGKTASTSTAIVGDTVYYTIAATNGQDATAAWVQATITDELPELVTFLYGSVQVDGESAGYSFSPSTRTLTIRLGDILPGQTVTATFAVTINSDAYGETIYNTALLTGDNVDDLEDTDEGITIDDGMVEPHATKAASVSTANVGDTILYTVTIENDRLATIPWAGAVMTDEISSYLTLTHGSVQLNGKTVEYSYSGGTLTIKLGDIAPGETATVTYEAVANSTAYGQTVYNMAVLAGENTSGQIEANDEGVKIGKGSSEGTAAKTASVSYAETGDTYFYTVTARNSSLATGAWESATITDTIPDYMTFVDGSVQIDGMSSNSYSYDGSVLKIYLGDIAPGSTAAASFRVTVDADAQGQHISNTAYVSSENYDTLTAPDNGVEIGAGEPSPSARKSVSVGEAAPDDIVTYSITISNSIRATADWKDVVITDVLPSGMAFVGGSVYVDGNSVAYSYVNQVLAVRLGDIIPGESVTMTFDAKVLDSAEGNTVFNVGYITSGNHDQLIVTDDGLMVPVIENYGGDEVNGLYGSKAPNKLTASPGDFYTYTIKAGNNTASTWYNVQIVDILDTSLIAFVDKSIIIDGSYAVAAEYTYSNKTLTISIGDVKPGDEVIVTFQVVVKNDAYGELISNSATLKGSSQENGNFDTTVRVKADDVRVPDNNTGADVMTGVHAALFIGYEDNSWRPDSNLTRAEAATAFYRAISKPSRPTTTKTINDMTSGHYWATEAVQYFLWLGALQLDSSGNFNPDDDCSLEDFNTMMKLAIGKDYGFGGTSPLSRRQAATLILMAQERSREPVTNGHALSSFTDVSTSSSFYWIAMEMAHEHDWYTDTSGNEYWAH